MLSFFIRCVKETDNWADELYSILQSWEEDHLPWQIVSVHPPSHTYQSFYDTDVKEKCLGVNSELFQVHVGKAKETLDLVDPSLTISDVNLVRIIYGNIGHTSCMLVSRAPTRHLPTWPQVRLYSHTKLYLTSILKGVLYLGPTTGGLSHSEHGTWHGHKFSCFHMLVTTIHHNTEEPLNRGHFGIISLLYHYHPWKLLL